MRCKNCGCNCTKTWQEETPWKFMRKPMVRDLTTGEMICTDEQCKCHDLGKGSWEVLGLDPPEPSEDNVIPLKP